MLQHLGHPHTTNHHHCPTGVSCRTGPTSTAPGAKAIAASIHPTGGAIKRHPPQGCDISEFPEVRLLPNPLPHWHKAHLFCDFHRAIGHSTNSCLTLRDAIQSLIESGMIKIHTHEASTSAPPSALAPALALASPHASIVHQPMLEHSNPEGAGTSGIHSLFPSRPATFVVDPSQLIHDISEPFPLSLYHAAVAGFESGIHMIRPYARPERSTAHPTMHPQAQAPVYLQARPQAQAPASLLGRPPLGPPVRLLARSQPGPSSPSQQHHPFSYRPVNTPVAPLVLAAHAPTVINLTGDTHRVPHNYTMETCAEVTQSGRVYKPTTPVARPSHPKPTVPPPSSQPFIPTIVEPTTKATPPTTKKGQPTINITP